MSASVHTDEASTEPLARLDVLLTIPTTLSVTARSSMLDEATAIWKRQGVQIAWLPPTSVQPVARHRLRVLVVQRRQPGLDLDEPFAVGELVRPTADHPVAVVSIEGARELIGSLRGTGGSELISFDDRRLGVVLGRVIAHEIGHHVLDTATHSRTGLMRPQFTASELADRRSGMFDLDRDAAAWLRNPGSERFVYVR
jgi:hypothetical protein